MARTLIGNIKGKDGRGITSIEKTGTTGPVDTYTITYTDSTTSTFTVNNSDSIALQRQIVPSAAIESSATASQAYEAGDYVVVNGILRKVKSSIAKGNTISDSNSTATTVTDGIKSAEKSASVLGNIGKMFIGSDVYTVSESSTSSGNEVILFTEQKFVANFGRPFDKNKDFVGVMNSDGVAANTYITSATYFASGGIRVGVPGIGKGSGIRLNYLVMLGK